MKTVSVLLIPLLLIAGITLAIGEPPEVTNLSFSQRLDGSFLVDIYYDLSNPSPTPGVNVWVVVSTDGGSTWGYEAEAVSGDEGAGVEAGAGKHIVWDIRADFPSFHSNDVLLKLVVENNWPPEAPLAVNPEDGAVDVPPGTQLTWQCSDPDGDALTYTVHFGTSETPPQYGEPQTATTVTLPALEPLTMYYWKVTASDQRSSVESDLFSFTMSEAQNTAPYFVENGFSPAADSVDVPLDVVLLWSADDADEDDVLSYTVRLGQGEDDLAVIASGLSDTLLQINPLEAGTRYYWQVSVTDRKDTVESGMLSFTTLVPNTLPEQPELVSPAQDSVINGETVELVWSCSDTDGDALSYALYFGETEEPDSIAGSLTDTMYVQTGLEPGRQYYWQVIAKDDNGARVEGPLWRFNTNTQPGVPTLVSPAQDSVINGETVELVWSCSDTDGDALRYALYFGETEEPDSIAGSLTDTMYVQTGLEPGRQYYWRVIAKDDNGARVEGPLWSFSTNTPPGEPVLVSPEQDSVINGETVELVWSCSDPDGDALTYDIYFGESASPPLTESDHSGTTYTPAALANSTTYYWKVVAKDGNGGETEGPVWFFNTGKDIGAMVLVDGGTFMMGCNQEIYDDCFEVELPLHEVTVSSFYIGKYEVTQGEYETLMGTNPSSFSGSDNLPVERVAWYDVVEYCNALSVAEGLDPCYVIGDSYVGVFGYTQYEVTCDFTKNGYRLPTEAEWEYAARGGNQSQGYKYAGSDNIKEVAWYNGNSFRRTHEAGTKSPNELGIYDMSGNVFEWCWDWYSNSYYSSSPSTNPTGPSSGSGRVLRGGNWGIDARSCRVSFREYLIMAFGDIEIGFRLARTTDGSTWNQSPAAPNTPVPADAATGVSISPTLEWQCSDPDGDALTYDIYFGESTTPPLAESDYTGTTYTPAALANSTTYYWKVVAKDGNGGETEGPVWSFTTESGSGGGGTPIPGMVYVEGGTFTMGCTAEQGGDCYDNETPTHEVTLSSFYIGKYEVTQGEYESLMGTNPSAFSGSDNLPVENLTWYAMVEYCNALSVAEGLEPCYVIDGENTTCDFTKNGYRLPTEAEREYAARGGNQSQGYKYSGSDNIEEVAWYRDNSSVDGNRRTHEVGTKSPNELGIYDMSGNVYEWCWDWYGSYSSSSVTNPTGPSSGSSRVRRGGSWYGSAWYCRVAHRSWRYPANVSDDIGFRLARTE